MGGWVQPRQPIGLYVNTSREARPTLPVEPLAPKLLEIDLILGVASEVVLAGDSADESLLKRGPAPDDFTDLALRDTSEWVHDIPLENIWGHTSSKSFFSLRSWSSGSICSRLKEGRASGRVHSVLVSVPLCRSIWCHSLEIYLLGHAELPLVCLSVVGWEIEAR